MSDTATAFVVSIAIILALSVVFFVIFYFGLFPNLVTFLGSIRWITLTPATISALYWTIVFLWILGAFKSVKFK
jgi:hypothetical protein